MTVPPIAETDLYPPLRDYLVAQGYTVRSEVRHCDVVAVKGEELIVIELKRGITLTLLEQAVERQRISPSVYVAVPRPENVQRWQRRTADTQRVLRRLELGLILIGTTPGAPPVDIRFHPATAQRRTQPRVARAVLQEVARRSADCNQGGSTRRKLVTAYRENAIHVACRLAEHGPLSPRALRALGTGPKTLAILSRNVYGWFARVQRGVYGLTASGQADLVHYPTLVAHYRQATPAPDERP